MLTTACNENEDNLIFEKTADERVAEATAELKQRLVAPPNGWIVRYQPIPESGVYNVLLNFSEDGNVRIRTDFGANDNEFYDQNITYRIDNSLGLELIFENYSFFSFLFEQNAATLEAEYEFNYVNETPEGALVFSSKSDLSSLTILAFEQAQENAESLLGRALNANLETLSASLGVISPVYRLNYANRDLSLYLSFNSFLRTVSFTYATPLSGEGGQAIDFSTGYTVQGNSILLGESLAGNFQGNEVNIPSITFSQLADAADIEACAQTIDIQQYQGNIGESNETVTLLPTLFDPAGAAFRSNAGTYLANPGDIYDNGESVGRRVTQDIEGMIGLVLYNFDREQDPFVALGFGIISNDELVVPARNFAPTYTDNQVEFNLETEYDIVIGDTTAVLDTIPMNSYINNLVEGGNTRILQSGPGIYEFYNPCTGWSAILRRLWLMDILLA